MFGGEMPVLGQQGQATTRIPITDQELQTLIASTSNSEGFKHSVITTKSGHKIHYVENHSDMYKIKGEKYDDVCIYTKDESKYTFACSWDGSSWVLMLTSNRACTDCKSKYSEEENKDSYIEECECSDKGLCLVLDRAVEEACDELRSELEDEYIGQIDELNERISDLECEIEEFQDRETDQDRIYELENTISDLEADIEALNDEISDLRAELDDIPDLESAKEGAYEDGIEDGINRVLEDPEEYIDCENTQFAQRILEYIVDENCNPVKVGPFEISQICSDEIAITLKNGKRVIIIDNTDKDEFCYFNDPEEGDIVITGDGKAHVCTDEDDIMF